MLDNLSRQKIFWLLKRYSSLTLWLRIQEAQQPFFKAIEDMVKTHPQNDPDWMQIELYKRSLNDAVNFENGLRRLASGDRSVFRRHSEGFLVSTSSAGEYIVTLLNRGDCPEEWEYLGDLARATGDAYEGANGSFEPKDGEVAKWYATWILLDQNLPNHAFPDPLPGVPLAPEPAIAVKTGEEVPVDGIYEPESEGTCMNYLLGGIIAPKVKREYGPREWELPSEDGSVVLLPSVERITTTWRLIWADHRYEDGTVPEEEKDYFLPKPKDAVAASTEAMGRALPGERCLREGYWYTHAKEGSRRHFKEGELFPDFPDSTWGATIWYWDECQDE